MNKLGYQLCALIINSQRSYTVTADSQVTRVRELAEEELQAVANTLLLGLDEKYAQPWRAFNGVGQSPMTMQGVSGHLKLPFLTCRNRVDYANDRLSCAVYQRILRQALMEGKLSYDYIESPFVVLGLSSRPFNVLNDESVFSLREVQERFSVYVLRYKTPNMGVKSANEVCSAMKRKGLSLREHD